MTAVTDVAGRTGAAEAQAPTHAVRLRPRATAALLLVSAVGLVGFLWPLVAGPDSLLVGGDGPWLFALLLPLLLAVLVAEVSDDGLDAKAVAMLGVLAAVAAALRPLGPGVAGLEPMFVVFVLGGRVLGPGFGFLLGTLGMFASALITGGMGPWLPFQMLAAGWVGMGAGLLPGRGLGGRRETALLAAYAMVACLTYGMLLNLWLWPTLAGDTLATDLSYVPGAGPVANLGSFALFSMATSLGWDLVRGTLNASLVLVAGPVVLLALRRAARRANFAPGVAFAPSAERPAVEGPAVEGRAGEGSAVEGRAGEGRAGDPTP